MSKNIILRWFLLIALTIILSTASCSLFLDTQTVGSITASPQKIEIPVVTAALPTKPISSPETPYPSPTASLPTEEIKRLTFTPAVGVSPSSISNFGPTLAFLKDGDIWILDQPGSESVSFNIRWRYLRIYLVP